jgi:aminoglycoside phosphotransferase
VRIADGYRAFDLATDAGHMIGRLAAPLAGRLGDADLQGLDVPRAMPRKPGGFMVQYRLPRHDGGALYLYGVLVAAGEDPPAWADRADHVVHLDDIGLYLPVFPFDPRLRSLPDVLAAGAADLGIDAPADASADVSVLAYRLERRCVMRCRVTTPAGDTRSVVVKAVPRSRLDRFVDGHERLVAAIDRMDIGRELTVPRLLGVDRDRGFYVMEDVPGQALYELVSGVDVHDAHARAGRALCRLHGLPLPDGPRRTCHDESAQLGDWIGRVAPMFPEVAGRLEDCLARVQDEIGAADDPDASPALIHGDFYDKQILFDGHRITILDTDNLVAGDPAQDLGNFAAHVRLRQLQAPGQVKNLAAARHAFLAAYGAANGSVARRAVWWRRATTLRLAALYALRPRWRFLVTKLLEEIETCVHTGL